MHLILGALADLNPGNFIAWIIVGGLAGWIAGRFFGGGWGFFGDIILGLLGALLGALIVGLFVQASFGFWGTLLVSVLGSAIILAISRAIRNNRTPATR
ncbi:MAG TPA: GlsB/YeaQ/YmgE family stress response membrane protein [Ktedonobacterales bacterium]|nr:GlsB/YeaQ/YmgE family stress response membrane protein [Ktedonobacterales bacterium]